MREEDREGRTNPAWLARKWGPECGSEAPRKKQQGGLLLSTQGTQVHHPCSGCRNPSSSETRRWFHKFLGSKTRLEITGGYL